jgi:hypothetical protein
VLEKSNIEFSSDEDRDNKGITHPSGSNEENGKIPQTGTENSGFVFVDQNVKNWINYVYKERVKVNPSRGTSFFQDSNDICEVSEVMNNLPNIEVHENDIHNKNKLHELTLNALKNWVSPELQKKIKEEIYGDNPGRNRETNFIFRETAMMNLQHSEELSYSEDKSIPSY